MPKPVSAAQKRALFVFEHNGVKIYHCLRWCGRIWMGWLYATNPAGIRSEAGDKAVAFDVRDQPGGRNVRHFLDAQTEHIRIIKAAIDANALRTIADVHHSTEPPPPFENPEDENPF